MSSAANVVSSKVTFGGRSYMYRQARFIHLLNLHQTLVSHLLPSLFSGRFMSLSLAMGGTCKFISSCALSCWCTLYAMFFSKENNFVSQILKVHSANRHEKNHQFFSLAPARAATVTSRTVLREQKDHMFCASDPKVFWRCGLKFWIHLMFQKRLRCGCGLQKRTIINPQNTVPWCFEVWSHMENLQQINVKSWSCWTWSSLCTRGFKQTTGVSSCVGL